MFIVQVHRILLKYHIHINLHINTEIQIKYAIIILPINLEINDRINEIPIEPLFIHVFFIFHFY